MDTIYYVLGVIIVIFLIVMGSKFVFRKTKPDHIYYIMHYADWCPFCQEMKPIWEKVTNDLSIINGKIYHMNDTSVNPVAEIETIPTIIRHNPDGTEDKYSGERDEAQLRTFLSVV